MAEDRVGESCRGVPVYSSEVGGGDGSGSRPALVTAASHPSDGLTPPRVHAVLVLDLQAGGGRGRGRTSVGGASASQTGGRSSDGRSQRGALDHLVHLVQDGALPQRVQTGAATSWGGLMMKIH